MVRGPEARPGADPSDPLALCVTMRLMGLMRGGDLLGWPGDPEGLDCPVVAEESRVVQLCGDLAREREVPGGSWLFRQGDVPTGFYQLAAGRVRICVADRDGHEQVVALVEPPALFGEAACFGWMPYSTSAVTTRTSRVRFFPREAVLERLRSHPDLAVDLLRSLARKMHLFAVQLERAAFRSASERLELLLEALAARYGVRLDRGILLDLRLTHEELARMIGATRVTVTREMARLTRLGYIRRDSSGRLVLPYRRHA